MFSSDLPSFEPKILEIWLVILVKIDAEKFIAQRDLKRIISQYLVKEVFTKLNFSLFFSIWFVSQSKKI